MHFEINTETPYWMSYWKKFTITALPIKNGIKIAISTRFFQIKIGYMIKPKSKSQIAAASKIQAVPFLLDCNLPFLS